MGKRRNKKFEPYVLENITLDKFVNGGQALGYGPDKEVIFAWGGLPGEKVDIRITKAKRGILEGVVEVVKDSSGLLDANNRAEPKEPEEYMSTSPWQILDFAYENQVKLDLLKQTFKHEAGIDLGDIDMAYTEAQYGYRNKMEYNFWGDDAGLHLALHKRGSGQKIKLTGSSLASDAINRAGQDLVAALNEQGIFAGDLKSLVLRSSGSGDCVAALFVKKESFKKFQLPQSIKGLACYYSNPKSPASVITKELWQEGDVELIDEISGVELGYDVDSFFQVNVGMFEAVLEDIRAKLLPDLAITDFYGGVGSIGILTSGKDRKLKIVELDVASAKMAKKNIKRLDLSEAEVINSASEDVLEQIESGSVLVIDPPRAGLHKKVVQQIVEVKPRQVVYLSCNPVTQARDLKDLAEVGYKIVFSKGYNFFPRTPHIESLVIVEL